MTERFVVVGGDAAGMSAASQAKRLRGDALEVVAFERGHHTSYSACGIPYWVGGEVDGPDALVARSAEQHRRNGVDLRMRTCVEEVDLARGEVVARDLEGGTTYRVGFDSLLLATGARPFRPPLPGVDAAGVHGVQTLDDGAALLRTLEERRPRQAVVVGGGYVGVEIAEAMLHRGIATTIVTKDPEIMTTLDPDMGRFVHEAVEGEGITVEAAADVQGFETDAAGRVRCVVTGAARYDADVVVLGIGVRPESGLAVAAGLPVGASGGVRTDLRMRVCGQDVIYAAGDCVETFDRVSRSFVHVPLGTHANKQGRAVGTNVGGGYATFPGVVRTAVSKVCAVEIGRTGLLEAEARRTGFDHLTVTVASTTRAGYYPGAAPVTVKLLGERRTGRLLGAQIVGREDAAKRIDTCAVALWNGMTAEDMTALDLGYAPPFSPVWDPVLIAARKLAEAVEADRGA